MLRYSQPLFNDTWEEAGLKRKMKIWLKGLLSALISGASVSIGAMAAAPQDFNLQSGCKRLLIVAAFSGLVSAANYLKQSPLPGIQKND